MENSLEPKAFELVCYMATSAANLLRENPLYGPFRLVDAASRLITALEEEGIRSTRLSAVRAKIVAGQYTVMEDEEIFARFLEDLVLTLVPLIEEEP
jgi:hypothetical protein